VLGKPNNQALADAEVKRVINRTPGVIGIVKYETDYTIDQRKYDINGEVLTEWGIVEFTTFEEPAPTPPVLISTPLEYTILIINA
jgi:hypothetical protein